MADEKNEGQCLPSQVTINIGTSGVKINDGTKTPEIDLTPYLKIGDAAATYATKAQVNGISESVRGAKADAAAAKAAVEAALTKEAADAAYAPKSQVSGIAESVRAVRTDAAWTKATAEASSAKVDRAEAAVQSLGRRLALQPRVIRLDPDVEVPADTPLGTIIVRPIDPLSGAAYLFAPISEWPKVNASETGDGVWIGGTGGQLVTGIDQLKTSEGTWHLTLRYSYPGGNFGETEGQCPIYAVRRFQEGDRAPKTDQGRRIGDLTVTKGEHRVLEMDIEPRKVDPNVGDVWGIWIEAPIGGLTIHDLALRRTS
uniref:Uncharacterized protein n=1 Tax=Dulem virus 38 TaxID=3145756 RepID=A0AAU8B0F4_9CAUD